MDVAQLLGKKVSVIGAARSGVGVSRLLKRHGAKVFVSDVQAPSKLEKSIAVLRSENIEFEAGNHTERMFDCSLIVLSPGVPGDTPVVIEAKKRGIRIVSELEAASWFCKAPIVAITGSNGKTTTTTLIGRIFDDAKKKHVVAGNIGEAFSNFVLDVAETDVVVLEVSSFQLDCIETFHPRVALLLNITRNHMDRYENSMEKYAASKARIFMNQRKDDVLIYNADDEWCRREITSAQCRTFGFSTRSKLFEGAFIEDDMLTTLVDGRRTEVIGVPQISIKGEHNVQNAMAAALAAQTMGLGPATVRATLKNFKGVEHRQEFVREVNGIKYINDSKATTVEAVSRALNAFSEPIVLILGGKDKGNDYSQIYDSVKRKVRAIVAVGYSAEKIVNNFAQRVHVERVDTIGSDIPNITSMRKALDVAASLAQHGDVVLLSPACTSFDWFVDYEERGRVFKSLVLDLGTT